LKISELCIFLKLLEDSTFLNPENANFLLSNKEFVGCLMNCISEEETSVEILVLVVKVLINLTNDNPIGDSIIGKRISEILSYMKNSGLQVELFPLLVVLLINLVENSVENRKKFEISFILSLFAESDVKQVSKKLRNS
jgi:hypothetical protein